LDDRIGSLTIGKCADITAVRVDEVEVSPAYDPHSQFVYACGREHVSHVWVNGKLLLDDRRLTTLDTHEIIARASYWQDRIGTQ
jgi:5-methylthioadenosine/S-adenosylhomocysteine deaminase